MPSYDYNQVPAQNPVYQPSYNPIIDPNTQYSMIPSYPPPPAVTHYPPMMNYPMKTDANVLPSPQAPVQMSYPNGAHGGISSKDFCPN